MSKTSKECRQIFELGLLRFSYKLISSVIIVNVKLHVSGASLTGVCFPWIWHNTIQSQKIILPWRQWLDGCSTFWSRHAYFILFVHFSWRISPKYYYLIHDYCLPVIYHAILDASRHNIKASRSSGTEWFYFFWCILITNVSQTKQNNNS